MSAPAPHTALANQVTAVHANTLYSFQPDAFQSISLANNSQWNSLPMGVSVNGSQAVLGQSAGQDALFIVGGRSNASEQSFPGLQKFSFGSNAWQALTPETSVAQNRVQHGAAFLQQSKSILIFGGSQDNSYTATSQTYTISAEEPYAMKSYPAGAPAVQNPILLPFNASHALLAGGGAHQEQIWTFSESDGWAMMTTTVPGGVADASKVQGAISTDGSGNKQLQLFDMSQSPYKVSTISLSSQFHKREAVPVIARDDSSLVQTPRSGFSLAQDPSTGNVVISGGTSDEKAGSLAIFNAASKAFEDPSSVFGTSGSSSSGSPSSSSGTGNGSGAPKANGFDVQSQGSGAAPSSTAGSAPASSGAPVSSGAPSASQAASAGASGSPVSSGAASAASGSVSGAASATNSAETKPTGTAAVSGSTAASGASGASKPTSSAGSTAAGAAAAQSSAAGEAAAGGASSSSTGIILGAVLGSFAGIALIFALALLCVRQRRKQARDAELRQQALNEKRADSPASSIGSINNGSNPYAAARSNPSPFQNGQTPQISRPTLDPQIQAEDLAPPRKLGNDDEWGRYFNNNDTVENLYPGDPEAGHADPSRSSHLGGAAMTGAAAGAAAAGVGFAAAAGARNTAYTVGSEYTIDSPTSSGPRESAVVPPLYPHNRQSSQAHFEHARTLSDVSSKRHTYDSYSANTNSGSGPDSWDPTALSNSSGGARPASSVYYDRASSIYPPNPLSPTTMSHFPPVPQVPGGFAAQDKGMRSIISTDFGSGSPPQGQNGGAFPESPVRRVHPGNEPRSAGNASGMGGEEKDLSWLRIGSAN